jgi:tRNA (cmo5U34)-methyltransferase
MNEAEQADKIKAHFDSEFADYDFCADKVVPRNTELQRKLVKAIPNPRGAELNFLDLGVGTGQTSLFVLEEFPRASLIGVDLSAAMLEVAHRRLARYDGRVRLVQSDFCKADFASLGAPFDCVFSAASIHNCLDEDKRALFAKIAGALKPGGCFVNADFFKFESDVLAKAARDYYVDFVKNNLNGAEREHWVKHATTQDIPASIEAQSKWLRDAGFSGFEPPHIFENTVVYRAFR